MQYREAVKNGKSSNVLRTVMYDDDTNLDKNKLDKLLKSLEERETVNNEPIIESSFAGYDKIQSVNEIDYSNINFYYEYNEADSMIGRFSNRFYMYFVLNSALISIHPSNPTHDYTLCSTKMEPEPNESLYCVSKKYGVFYTNGKKTVIYHSSLDKKLSSFNDDNTEEKEDLFYDLRSPSDKGNQKSVERKCVIGSWRDNKVGSENDSKINQDMEEKYRDRVFMTIANDSQYIQLEKEDIRETCQLSYDESYGISGRLLLYCINFDGRCSIQQFFNFSELTMLEKEIDVIKLYVKNDYLVYNHGGMIPGVSKPPFNMIVETFKYLYGDSLIHELGKSIFVDNGDS